jgi:flagellar protein FliO/FliZ
MLRALASLPILFSPPVQAADGSASAVPPAPSFANPAPDLGSSALSMIFGLIVVLALLLGALWLMKRLGQPHRASAGLMRVIAGVAVGPRERVVILELGSSWLVLGVAPGQVNTLAEIPRQEIPASARHALPADAPAWLGKWLDRRGKPSGNAE